jgi:hypothetical protein
MDFKNINTRLRIFNHLVVFGGLISLIHGYSYASKIILY